MSSVMQALLSESVFDNLKEGTIIKGTVTEIRPNEVIIDIGAKAEGPVPISEFSHIDDLQVGQEISVFLEKIENRLGTPVLSFDKAEQKKNWENILTQYHEGAIAPCRVKGKVKGGLIISVAGVDAFLPSSQIDVQAPKELDRYIGQTFDVKILRIKKDNSSMGTSNIVVSRRELIEEQRNEKRRNLLAEITIGDIRRGVVKNITDYGAFIDLDGLDGLLHITDMSWGRVSHPSEVLKVGEEIQVMVTDIDKERERVSLGLKQTLSNPWEGTESKYPVGGRIKGKVVNLVPFGAFVELEPGVEGLIHLTEFSWIKRITKPSEMLKVGQDVEAIILGVQKDKQNISLGLRQLESNPWEMVQHNYPTGARVRGKVRNLTTFGAFIELEEGIDGMIHVSDMSWTRKINHPSEMLKKGDEVEAIVLGVDPDQQRIALGIKQISEDPWQNIDSIFKTGDVVTGKVSKIASYGAFVELKNGIDGLVHISHVSEDHVAKIKDVLKVGDEVNARVVKVDRDERRIGLSIKAANYDERRLKDEIATYERLNNDQQFTSLGDILDQATNASLNR